MAVFNLRRTELTSVVICLASGVALSLAFPRTDLWWLAWIALAPLMHYVYQARLRVTLACGLAFGIGFFASHLYWIIVFGRLPWAALAVFQALFVVVWALAARMVGARLGPWGRLFLLPALWVSVEWLRSLGMLGFTWGDIGYSQHEVLPLIQIASITGVWGVSFLVALGNALVANTMTFRRVSRHSIYAQTALVVLVMAVVTAYGAIALRSPTPSEGRFRAAAIQGNIDQNTRQGLDYYDRCHLTYRALTERAASGGAELIVWPETSEPGYPARDVFLERALSHLSMETGAHILVGAHDEDPSGSCFNSGFMIAPGRGIISRYSKVRLVPFGEYVPARRYLPFLSYYRVTAVDLSPGPGFNLLNAGRYRLGLAICFESIFPYISRTLTRSGAEILCVITNDTWFKRTAAADQHASKSVFRAVENGRYLVRAASTGVSCIIDPRGRVLARKGIFTCGIVEADVTPLSRLTLYTRMGDWFVYLCLAVVGAFSLRAILKRRRYESI